MTALYRFTLNLKWNGTFNFGFKFTPWSQYPFLHLYAIHFLYVYPWKFGVLLGIIFFSFHHLSAWKLLRKRFLYYISNHYPGSEWLIHLITRFLMVAQDVQCNTEEPPQTSFVSGQIGPVAFPHYMKYTEPTPVQGEMVTWFGTVLFAVTVTILSSNFQICSGSKMWNFVFIVRHLNCMFQQLIHCKRSHTIVSILHDYILRSMQYHLYEICQSQLKTQSLTVTSCENWGENFNFFFFFKNQELSFEECISTQIIFGGNNSILLKRMIMPVRMFDTLLLLCT